MPGFDRTGPFGEGPRTGRGRGVCGRPTDRVNRGIRGVGRGGTSRGGGRGRCLGGRGPMSRKLPLGDPSTLSPTEEVEALKAQLASAEAEIASLRVRLEEQGIKG